MLKTYVVSVTDPEGNQLPAIQLGTDVKVTFSPPKAKMITSESEVIYGQISILNGKKVSVHDKKHRQFDLVIEDKGKGFVGTGFLRML